MKMAEGRPTSEYIPLLARGPSDPVHMIPAPPQNYQAVIVDGENCRVKRWPWFVWFLLKFIGLFNNSQCIVRRSKCPSCLLSALKEKELGSDEGLLYPGELESNEDEPLDLASLMRSDACVVCRGEWFDGRGRFRPYTETDIGVDNWNHRGSTILSIIWPLTLLALVIYDFSFYLKNYWGKREQIIRLISYSTFLLFTVSTPLLSVFTSIYNMMRGRQRNFCWSSVLNIRYIVKRLQYLELVEHGLPHKLFIAVCLLWPCLNGVFRMVIFYDIVQSTSDGVHTQISLDVGLVCMLVFGAFCYLMLLLRISFQKQLHLELAFLRRHEGSLDVCRRRLTLYAGELGSMSMLVFIWIIFIVAVSTWGFTTQISWNYLRMSNTTGSTSPRQSRIQNHLDFLIWSEDFMFLALPLVAVGGINLNRLWIQLKRGISQMRTVPNEDFWDRIMVFCQEQSPMRKVKVPTLMFSALGLILGLKFADQNIDYWGAKSENLTNVNLI
ncbi:uncharacterized protein [Asterias amurensis]|uniref:uncharacterized protein n=1 Tax=Asterias amurensis TaxID=7602 RepID=UPI003AB7C370